MRRKRVVADWVYYAFAVLVTLLTIPMYRYLFAHANDVRPVVVYQSGVQQVKSQTSEQEQLRWVKQERLREYEQSRRSLAPNQRCIGGVVIEVEGSTYTQLGSFSRPIHCADGYADQPLR